MRSIIKNMWEMYMLKNEAKKLWATMITPFTEEGNIDYPILGSLLHWYEARGVENFFTVCLSSEMMNLSLNEKIDLAKYVKDNTDKKHIVAAAGHVGGRIEQQIEDIGLISKTGVDIIVIVLSLLVSQSEDEEVLFNKIEKIITEYNDVDFGIYECPFPYKRLISDELLKRCNDTGRFVFFKDTCCNLKTIERRLKILSDSKMKLYNANTATLLESLKLGSSGYCGVMANFHPELYYLLLNNWDSISPRVDILQAFLTMASLLELHAYPVNAKYYLSLNQLGVGLNTRRIDVNELNDTYRVEMHQLKAITEEMNKYFTEQLNGHYASIKL